MRFTDQQREALLRPIKPSRVAKDEHGFSYVEAHDIKAHLNRIFGFEGWDEEIISLALVSEREVEDPKRHRQGYYVTYRCGIRITVHDASGAILTRREGAACGSSANLPDLGEAHDMACKNSQSFALKRACIGFGDQFGLSLYNNGSLEPIVKKVAAYDDAVEPPGPLPGDPQEDLAPAPDPPELPPSPASPKGGRPRARFMAERIEELQRVTAEQRKKLFALARDFDVEVHEMCSNVLGYGVGSLALVSKNEASRIIDTMEAGKEAG